MAVKICCGFGVAGSADNGTTKAAGGGRAWAAYRRRGQGTYREKLKCRIQPYHERCGLQHNIAMSANTKSECCKAALAINGCSTIKLCLQADIKRLLLQPKMTAAAAYNNYH